MSGDNQNFAHISRAMGIAVTRQSLLTTWKKLQESWGELSGLSAAEAAEALGCDIATLMNWQLAYNDNGLEGLS